MSVVRPAFLCVANPLCCAAVPDGRVNTAPSTSRARSVGRSAAATASYVDDTAAAAEPAFRSRRAATSTATAATVSSAARARTPGPAYASTSSAGSGGGEGVAMSARAKSPGTALVQQQQQQQQQVVLRGRKQGTTTTTAEDAYVRAVHCLSVEVLCSLFFNLQALTSPQPQSSYASSSSSSTAILRGSGSGSGSETAATGYGACGRGGAAPRSILTEDIGRFRARLMETGDEVLRTGRRTNAHSGTPPAHRSSKL